ncbi:MAG: hypothetical protein ACYDCO_08660 [Armatimonadota bacterium]
MAQPSGDDRRRFFRLRYPEGSTARIIIGSRTFELTEVSERGVRFVLGPFRGFKIGQKLEAIVETRSGPRVPVVGTLLRYDEKCDEVIVHLILQGIPAPIMFEEQRYVIQNQRRHLRVFYPPGKGARLVVEKHAFEVMDVAEGGLRFKVRHAGEVPVGRPFAAIVEMHIGYKLDVKGVVIRYDQGGKEAVMQLTLQPLPAIAIRDEQGYVLRKFPDFKQPA